MSSKVELNKNGRPVNWHDQCWAYYKNMMELTFAEKEILEYANGEKTLADVATDDERKTFKNAQKRYEGKANAATRTNQEIVLFNKLQAVRCKSNWDVQQHVANMFLTKDQLAALKAEVRDPIFINITIKSLPANPRFDRLRGIVETGASEVDTPDKLRDQIIRMDSYTKCDREQSVLSGSTSQLQAQNQGQKQKSQGAGNNVCRSITPEKAAAIAAKKLDKQQDCPKKANEPSGVSDKKHVTYTRREQAHDEGEAKALSSTSSCTVEKIPSSAGVTLDPAEIKSDSKDLSVDATNVHIVSDRRYFVDYEPFDNDADCARGFKKKFEATPVGHGTVQFVVKRGKLDVVLILRDAFHVPDSKNLLSHTQAEDQGYTVEYNGRSGSRMYELWNDEEKLLDVGRDKYGLFTFTAQNAFLTERCEQAKLNKKLRAPMRRPRVNFSAADFVKIMIDRDLVKGMMLRQRTFDDWTETFSPKQTRSWNRTQNEIIFADLLFPEPRTSSGNQNLVLVIMNVYTRYTTVYPLKSKEAPDGSEKAF
ncbi:hypothetical protein PHPALM_30977 [Phytophthora palmivora]|uniref:Retrovirus-related Pol polyprotein from transposon TNT 1-94-like beta-barrel domain-containing protein n=1 Tax=Phytophthora palmivora TaxID=4796 RepID=A0A2P4X3S1_9STRA|nr:hypothetical protein PHPALM_30977 [Phytophthora palmivora]